MKFDYCIGNPPYQANQENTSDDPLYHDFMDMAYTVSDRVELITPARFLFNAGKTPKEWNKKMLNDEHFKVLRYEQNSKKIFDGKDIIGGIAITYRDANEDYGAIKHFEVNEEVGTVRDKIINRDDFESIKQMIYLQNKLNLDALYSDFPTAKNNISSDGREKRIVSSAFENLSDIFTDTITSNDDVMICGLIDRKRQYKYLNIKYLDLDSTNLKKYKVLLSAADGASGTIGKPVPARIIGNTSIEEINVGYTQTFISIGAFNTRNEAVNLDRYLHTKFARFMVGINKVTNGLKFEVWSDVPLQDFTSNSDIDWNKSISDIDKQLYKKYGLSKEEIDFIETHVKEMN